MISTALIRYNTSKRSALLLRDKVKQFLKENKIHVIDKQDRLLSRWGESEVPHFTYYNRRRKFVFRMGSDAKHFLEYKAIAQTEKADILVTIGGDGTLLFYKGFYNIPIFAIGSHTSFLCQAREEDWREKLFKVLENAEIVEHGMLEAKFGRHRTEPAMNEICIKNPRHRMLRFKLALGGKEYVFGADGVMFSTPLGSTGYAYSAGGKQFSKRGFYEVVPVAPHRRMFKPMLIRDDVGAVLSTLSRYQQDVVDVVVDGQIIYELGLNALIKIGKSKRKVSLLR